MKMATTNTISMGSTAIMSFVHYEDGSQENIVTALSAGRAAIADLDKFEVNYIVRALDTEN